MNNKIINKNRIPIAVKLVLILQVCLLLSCNVQNKIKTNKSKSENISENQLYYGINKFNTANLLNPDSNELKEWSMCDSINASSLVNGEDLSLDLRLLLETIVKVYPFSGDKNRFTELDAKNIINASIAKSSTKSKVVLGEILGELLAKWRFASGDRHFQIQGISGLSKFINKSGWRRYLYRLDVTDNEEHAKILNSGCTWSSMSDSIYPKRVSPWLAQYDNENSGIVEALFTVVYGDIKANTLICGTKEIELIPHNANDPTKKKSSLKDEKNYTFENIDGFSWIKIKSFSSRFNTELTAFVNDAKQHLKNKNIVIDLRGNGGGSNRYAYEWIKHLVKDEIILGSAYQRYSSDVLAIRANHLIIDRIKLSTGKPAGQDKNKLEKRIDKLIEQIENAPEQEMKYDGEIAVSGKASSKYNGRVIVLIDHNTASSAENFVFALKALPNSIIVGEPSGGFIEAGEVGVILLPRTGLLWGIPTKRFDFNVINIRTEAVGIPVDFYAPNITKKQIEDLNVMQ